MLDYFIKDANDIAFYDSHIKGRFPKKIVDAHIHMNLPEHVPDVTHEMIKNDWAAECGFVMPYEDSCLYNKVLFPDTVVDVVAFPCVFPEADIPANNEYLAKLHMQGKISTLMTVRPEWDASYCEEILVNGGFAGFKPYPYMADAVKSAEISIFDFLPHEQLAILEKHKKAVLIHLPRKGRLADDDNIREIKNIVNQYPNIKIVIAHYGRCFTYKYFEQGLQKLGDVKNSIYFDTAAVINPLVHRAAFEAIGTERVIFGTDMPVMLWHGRRRWTENDYFNLCREDFSWNKHEEPEKEADYTFFIYEQVNSILNVLQEFGGSKQDINNIFYNNAKRIYMNGENTNV